MCARELPAGHACKYLQLEGNKAPTLPKPYFGARRRCTVRDARASFLLAMPAITHVLDNAQPYPKPSLGRAGAARFQDARGSFLLATPVAARGLNNAIAYLEPNLARGGAARVPGRARELSWPRLRPRAD